MSHTKTGGCLCGAVRYSVNGPLRPATACHCSQCRRMTGSFWMSTACADTDLELTETRGLAWYHSSSLAKRGFCRECGSSLFWKADALDRTAITPGTLDGDSEIKIVRHIFCADKGDYYGIGDGLPEYGQGFRLPG